MFGKKDKMSKVDRALLEAGEEVVEDVDVDDLEEEVEVDDAQEGTPAPAGKDFGQILKEIKDGQIKLDGRFNSVDKDLGVMKVKVESIEKRVETLENKPTTVTSTETGAIGFIRLLGQKSHRDALEIEYQTLAYTEMLEKHGFGLDLSLKK